MSWAVCVVAYFYRTGGMLSPEVSWISLRLFAMNGMNRISFKILDQMFLLWFLLFPSGVKMHMQQYFKKINEKDQTYFFYSLQNNVCMNKWTHFSSQRRDLSFGVRYILFATGQYMVHITQCKLTLFDIYCLYSHSRGELYRKINITLVFVH